MFLTISTIKELHQFVYNGLSVNYRIVFKGGLRYTPRFVIL